MANSLSDKAVFLYDIFFSADITQGQLDSQIKQSSLFRIAFEEVLSYPNLLDKMKAHDRYDELIGIGTEAYSMIAQNATREENSQLEANCYIYITNENNTAVDFAAFLKTVSGHIGFGKIINNPKTSYDIADNAHAVELILSNSDAINALLNSENGLNAFGKNPVSQIRVYQAAEVFKQLRATIRFNQEGVAPSSFSTALYFFFKKVGDKYIYIFNATNVMFISDDMNSWTKVVVPQTNTGVDFSIRGEQHQGDCVGYDHLNKAWFFSSGTNNSRIKWTQDFSTWKEVTHNVGNSYVRTLSSWDDKIWFYDYTPANQWQLSYIKMEAGAERYVPVQMPNPNQISVYGKAPEDPDYPYMMWTDVNYNWKHMNKQGEFPYRVKDQNDWFYGHDGGANRTTRGITFANGYFFITFGTGSQMGITRLDLTHDNDVLWTWNARDIDPTGAKVTYWYNYETNNYMHVSYANGVYIIPITGGYATSINGVVWDEQLFDVTYSFLIKGADERGFYGIVPGTNFVLTSYDAKTSAVVPTTTTTTTTAPTANLPEFITNLDCLVDTTQASVVDYNGLKMLFNGESQYKNTNYVLTNGSYKIINVPEEYPIAVLNKGKYGTIHYTGSSAKRHLIKVRGTEADQAYDFFYGDVTINVTGNFERVSLYYYKTPENQGYLGMEQILVHQNYLYNGGTTASDVINTVANTNIYSSSIKNFDCVGNEALEKGEAPLVVYTTTTTTATPSYTVLAQETTTTTEAPFNYGDENYTTAIDVSTSIIHDIALDVNNKLTFDGTSLESLSLSGSRLCLGAGTYIFNVAEDLPIAIEGATSSPYFGPQNSRISYSGDFYKRSVKGINNVPYYFYHGQVVVIVDDIFSTVNLYSFDNGYAGGENAFSFSRVTTTTTAAPTTTTTTTDSNLTYTRCIDSDVSITVEAGNFILDGDPYDSNIKYGLNLGETLLRGVPQSHPIAILNYGKWDKIKYSGKATNSVSHFGSDGKQYSYYYGDVLITVLGDFGLVSFDCVNDGFMGGENKLIFTENCLPNVAPTTTTTTTADPLFNYTTTTTAVPTTTTTTTAAPTTTTTTTAIPTEAEFCLINGATANIVSYEGGEYAFNGNSGLYGMTTGTYTFKDVSASHPIAFLNYGKTSNVTYSGQYAAGNKAGLDGNEYPYYYGNVTVTVTGDFNFLSYECFYHGYMGGENNIIFDNTNCT